MRSRRATLRVMSHSEKPARGRRSRERVSAKVAAKSGASTLLQGGLAAAATGLGGPLAGISVSAVASALGRFMSSRGDERAADVFLRAAEEIQRRVDAGEQIRADGFFEASGNGRSAAEETAESLLLVCRDEASERKLPYMSNMLCEIAFDASVDLDMAHQAISAADQLTYRQLCIVQLAAAKNEFSLRADDYRGQGTFSTELFSVLQECEDLYRGGLVGFGGEIVFGLTDVKPAAMQLQGVGSLLHRLMRLNEIPAQDVTEFASWLRT